MATQELVQKKFAGIVNSEPVTKKLSKMVGEKNAAVAQTTLISIFNNNQYLQKCDPMSILGAAGVAIATGLPISPQFGYAYIVPYGNEAQFQIGFKGLIQLAHRTGQYKRLHAGVIHEGEVRGVEPLTGELIVGEKTSDEIVGYVAYMELLNGFDKTLYMTVEEMQEHAKKYSKSYNYDLKNGKKTSVWSTNFDAMAKKTVLKLLLSKWGVMSIEMQTVIQADQSVVDKTTFTYVDNGGNSVNREIIDVPVETQVEEEKTEFVNDETGEVISDEN